jgi:hypothetical protein
MNIIYTFPRGHPLVGGPRADMKDMSQVGGPKGGRAHCIGWNGINGKESNMWFPYVECV